MINHIRIDRLIQAYWPFHIMAEPLVDSRLPRQTIVDRIIQHAVEEDYVEDEDRSHLANAWHWGRIRYFYEKFSRGERVDPVMLDNVCHGMHVYPELLVIDGHHRLCGAYLAGLKTVPSNYSGRVDFLRWLEGKTSKRPESE